MNILNFCFLGDKIMLSAGGPIDPFWNMYAFHKDPEIIKMLDPYLIGRLCPEDLVLEFSLQIKFFIKQ